MEIYTADAWREAFKCVSSDWQEYEPEWGAESALLTAYHDIRATKGDAEVVAAVIEAAALSWQSWEPDAFLSMARSFMCAYSDLNEAMAQYIHENYPGTEPEWFKDDAPVWDGMISDDELMVEANGAVYFFGKPGSQRFEALNNRA